MTSAATVLRPQDLDELQAALRDTTGTLQIAGAGTAATWAGLLAPVDALLDTTALTGVITHNPGDMTVAVRAGTPSSRAILTAPSIGSMQNRARSSTSCGAA